MARLTFIQGTVFHPLPDSSRYLSRIHYHTPVPPINHEKEIRFINSRSRKIIISTALSRTPALSQTAISCNLCT